MNVTIDRECGKCGFVVKQSVAFREDNGRIIIESWLLKCSACEGFLKKPTLGEIRRAMILGQNESQ